MCFSSAYFSLAFGSTKFQLIQKLHNLMDLTDIVDPLFRPTIGWDDGCI